MIIDLENLWWCFFVPVFLVVGVGPCIEELLFYPFPVTWLPLCWYESCRPYLTASSNKLKFFWQENRTLYNSSTCKNTASAGFKILSGVRGWIIIVINVNSWSIFNYFILNLPHLETKWARIVPPLYPSLRTTAGMALRKLTSCFVNGLRKWWWHVYQFGLTFLVA